MALVIKKYKVRIKLIEDMLGTVRKIRRSMRPTSPAWLPITLPRLRRTPRRKAAILSGRTARKSAEEDDAETRTAAAVIAEEVETVQDRGGAWLDWVPQGRAR